MLELGKKAINGNISTIFLDLLQNKSVVYFVVLDDNYQAKLENQQDNFRFIGKRGNEVVVQENYVFWRFRRKRASIPRNLSQLSLGMEEFKIS